MFKNLKSIFIVPDENKPTEQPATENNPPEQPPIIAPSASVPSIPTKGDVDERIIESLEAALNKNNQEGFDYMEFRQSLQTLGAIIPEEPTMFKAAFSMAASMGLTLEKLLNSAEFYKGILEKEQQNFNKAVESQLDSGVIAKQKNVTILEGKIMQKREEIGRLTQEIQAHEAEVASEIVIINEATAKIENIKANFAHTLENVITKINVHIAKINTHLK